MKYIFKLILPVLVGIYALISTFFICFGFIVFSIIKFLWSFKFPKYYKTFSENSHWVYLNVEEENNIIIKPYYKYIDKKPTDTFVRIYWDMICFVPYYCTGNQKYIKFVPKNVTMLEDKFA